VGLSAVKGKMGQNPLSGPSWWEKSLLYLESHLFLCAVKIIEICFMEPHISKPRSKTSLGFKKMYFFWQFVHVLICINSLLNVFYRAPGSRRIFLFCFVFLSVLLSSPFPVLESKGFCVAPLFPFLTVLLQELLLVVFCTAQKSMKFSRKARQ
jgi:hypothetical protein